LLNQLSEKAKGIRKITRGAIVYLQDPQSSLEFELGDQDAVDIQEKIRVVSGRIRSLDFQPISENQSAEPCRRCAYVGLCRAGV
jgi:hypothetical protein